VGCFGVEILQGLRFVSRHSKTDVGHTLDNLRKMSDFLAQHPQVLPVFIEMGKETIEIFLRFFEESFEMGVNLLGQERLEEKETSAFRIS
jgi:hypothetical protein